MIDQKVLNEITGLDAGDVNDGMDQFFDGLARFGPLLLLATTLIDNKPARKAAQKLVKLSVQYATERDREKKPARKKRARKKRARKAK